MKIHQEKHKNHTTEDQQKELTFKVHGGSKQFSLQAPTNCMKISTFLKLRLQQWLQQDTDQIQPADRCKEIDIFDLLLHEYICCLWSQVRDQSRLDYL